MSQELQELCSFYNGKKVLVTGHTGFKGSWLTVLLSVLGAEVFGYSLKAPSDPSLFEILYGTGSSGKDGSGLKSVAETGGVCAGIAESRCADIRDGEALWDFYRKVRPDVVIHMAAQPIVRESYRIPKDTYEINVLGTVNLLECLRREKEEGRKVSFVNVTTDKVYLNDDRPDQIFREDDPLCGFDPYSNSKSCSELVTYSYRNSFFQNSNVRISTLRAGNVIGGGDFAKDRILPDCMRAWKEKRPVILRNPHSIRPYQHVLEPLTVYLTVAMRQWEHPELSGSYNIGPDEKDCVETAEICRLLSRVLEGFESKVCCEENAVHEAGFLRLDNRKLKETFSWSPRWNIGQAVEKCAAFAKALEKGESEAQQEMFRQIKEYFNE